MTNSSQAITSHDNYVARLRYDDPEAESEFRRLVRFATRVKLRRQIPIEKVDSLAELVLDTSLEGIKANVLGDPRRIHCYVRAVCEEILRKHS